ncbi:cystathionine gamma-synthase [Nigerium massiliense]|uniref:cystathionine gamma-synthase n=1 Tax=Nigerium massiliense TaxID=1522317 RepID=UPI00058B8550|nr:cystathionine gamma-synthase [Nigerium massiliense]
MTQQSRITTSVRAGIDKDTSQGAVVPPIYLSTNYSFRGLAEPRDYDYSRAGNPTRALLGQAVAGLEGGAGGTITASGMGAASAVLHGLLPAGSTLAYPHDCYGGSWRLFDALERCGHLKAVKLDLTAQDAGERIAELRPTAVWIETPSNPLLRLTDIAAVSRATHEAGGVVVADNTFCSPAVQRPLELGADVVVHSTTKYLNGHSDVVGGAIVAADEAVHAELAWWANTLGLTGGAFDSYLTLRGLRTLYVRMRQHQENAAALVAGIADHPALAALHYPGLASHPDHALASRQQAGFGAMVSIDLAGGAPAVRSFLDGLRFFSLAESLGGVESLVAHPATMTHASMPSEVQQAAGITEGLLRLSVGIEDREDLLADLTAALDRAA